MMNGDKIRTAIEIVVKAGQQINQLTDILDLMIKKALKDNHTGRRIDIYHEKEQKDPGGWLITSYIKDYARYEKNKKTPFSHLAIKVVLYDEGDMQISRWVPSIYIMYGNGEDEFEMDSLQLSSVLDEGCALVGDRLWCWKEDDDSDDGWAFAIPLVKLNTENDLLRHIVEPIKKLVDAPIAKLIKSKGNPYNAFPDDSIALRFSIDTQNNLCIIA